MLQLLNECQEFIRILSVKLLIQRGYQERIEMQFIFMEKHIFVEGNNL